jgi:tetratricopeptide (TPR) repeat protein
LPHRLQQPLYVPRPDAQIIVGFVPRDALADALNKAELAVRLQPELPEAHAALGGVALLDWDWLRAKNELSRALELEPRNAIAVYASAGLASLLGQADQKIQFSRADVAVHPLSPNAHLLMGMLLFADGRADEAKESLQEALRISPMYFDAQAELAAVLVSRGKFQQALTVVKSLPEGDDDLGRMAWSSAITFGMGQKLKADAGLAN